MNKQKVNDVAYKLADYGINVASEEHNAYQQEWGATCVEASIMLMESNGLTEVSYQDNKSSQTKFTYNIEELKVEKEKLIKMSEKYFEEGWY